MIELKNKIAIGCIVQWYEVDIYDNYIESVLNSLNNIKNKKNITIDLCFYLSQNIEEVDESQITMQKIFKKFLKTRDKIVTSGANSKIRFYPASNADFNNKNLNKYTIADYRREFNDEYCNEVDILMWGETDSLIPKQTFEVLDLLHTNNINQKVYKYYLWYFLALHVLHSLYLKPYLML